MGVTINKTVAEPSPPPLISAEVFGGHILIKLWGIIQAFLCFDLGCELEVDVKHIVLPEARLLFAKHWLGDEPHSLLLKDLRRWALVRAMKHANGNKADAAKLLGVSRPLVYHLLKELS